MSKILTASLLTAAFTLVAGCASNAEMPSTYRAKTAQFEEMDKTGDNRLTLDEINPELKLHAEFARWDENANGMIEENEFFEYIEAQ